MKHLLIIFSSILIATLIGCGSADAKTEVSVSTIQCGMCQKTIEKGLGTLKGVKSVHVSMEDKVAHVVHDPNVANLAAIESAISAHSLAFKSLGAVRARERASVKASSGV